jgi:hypothetical protein
MKETNLVRSTASGVFIRQDPGLGLLAYSPYSGLAFAVTPRLARETIAWLDGGHGPEAERLLGGSLGAGWNRPIETCDFPIPHLLPDRDAWPNLPTPKRPILVNWLITGRCPLACQYCYAEDLMRNDANEPTASDVVDIATAIKSMDPLIVVLTGGDPLFTPHLATAVEALSGTAGLVVDTSAYTLTDEHITLFKAHRVAIRVSLDSERPKVHLAQRPPYPGYPAFVKRGRTMEAALNGLCRCLDAGLVVTVQSVATKKTTNDLVGLGDKLFRIGVRSWRVFKVAPSRPRMEQYRRLVGHLNDAGRPYKRGSVHPKGPYEHFFRKVLLARKNSWSTAMAVQVTHNETPNSVVLVSPDGRFVTESNTGAGKVPLDPARPRHPRLSALRSVVNMSAHAARYLNMTSAMTLT